MVPGNLSVSDTNPVELGVKFKSDIGGFITGVRFYKGPTSFGTHQASLWTASGTRLATALFTSETASGWQQVNFGAPVPITANTTYVASYHNNLSGGYAADAGYFANTGVDSWPLHALQSDTISGGNGVYTYGPTAFPSHLSSHANYWVDVVFAQTTIDTTDLDISNINVTVLDGSTATITWTTSRDATSRIDYSTDPSFPEASTFTAQNGAFVTQHSLTLTGLTPNATYYYTITSVDHLGVAEVSPAPSFTVPNPARHGVGGLPGGHAEQTYVAESIDGEVTLAPTAGAEFSGPDLPGRGTATWAPGLFHQTTGAPCGRRARRDVRHDPGGAQSGNDDLDTVRDLHEPTPRVFRQLPGDQSQHAGLGQTPRPIGTVGRFQHHERRQTLRADQPGKREHRHRPGNRAAGILPPLRSTDARLRELLRGRGVRRDSPAEPRRSDAPIAASDFNPFGGIVFVDWSGMTRTRARARSRFRCPSRRLARHPVVAKAPSGTSV